MKLVYWVCACLDDRPCYNIRERTREDARRERAKETPGSYGQPTRVEIEYTDPLDLVRRVKGEGNPEPYG